MEETELKCFITHFQIPKSITHQLKFFKYSNIKLNYILGFDLDYKSREILFFKLFVNSTPVLSSLLAAGQ